MYGDKVLGLVLATAHADASILQVICSILHSAACKRAFCTALPASDVNHFIRYDIITEM
jgi:hypothetical protein